MTAATQPQERRVPIRSASVLVGAALMAGTAVALSLSVTGWQPLHSDMALPWWLLAGLFAAAESMPIRTGRHRDHSITAIEVPLVIGLAFVSPGVLITARLVGSSIALQARHRLRPVKTVYNIAVFGFETMLAVVVYRGLAGDGDVGSVAGWMAAIAAAAAAAIASIVAVRSAIALHRSERPTDGARTTAVSLGVTVGGVGVGMMVVTMATVNPIAGYAALIALTLAVSTTLLLALRRSKGFV